MPFEQLFVLAVVQGVTEFLPISSSAHLQLVPMVMQWNDQGLIIDIAVHAGTIGAVILYLWRDILGMLGGLLRFRARNNPGLDLVGRLVIATLPIIAAGAVVFSMKHEIPRSAEVIGWATILFGILLLIVDRLAPTRKTFQEMTWWHALVIGLLQIFALIPGASRAGVTITAARMLGLERTAAARFSMLLAIPTTLAASTIAVRHLYMTGSVSFQSDAAVAAGLAFAAGFTAILFMMTWIRRASFLPFVIYRLVLGVAVLVYLA